VRPQADSASTVAAPGGTRVHRAWLELLGDLREAGTSRPEPGTDELVFETVRDGVRYRLSRCAAAQEERIELSAREHEVARMVGKGYTNKTIAAVLDISTWTVDTYLRRIFSKLDVRSRSAMVTRLAHDGIIDPADTPDWSEAWSRRR
jgi:DNA-binding CsgD family transcriptional regulator